MSDCNQELTKKASLYSAHLRFKFLAGLALSRPREVLSRSLTARSSSKCYPYNNKLAAYLRLTRLTKPIGIFLLMWPMLWALWLAGAGHPPISTVTIFILGCILMRSAGCVMNDLADQDWDEHVERTQHRPLVTGDVTRFEAKCLVLSLSLMAFGLVCLTNLKTTLLSVAGILLASIYPFTKRFTYWPQFILGLAFAWAIPMSYSALQVPMNCTTFLLYVGTAVWAMAYDTLYAMVDRADDVQLPIKSTALRLGRWDRLFVLAMHSLMMFLLFIVAEREQLSYSFYVIWGMSWGLIAYQHVIIRYRSPSQCFKAFLHNHYLGMSLFIALYFGL